jgi:hypothetical protein
MFVLLVNGPPRSGKDTFADMISDIASKDGPGGRQFKFADPVKKGAHASLGIMSPPEHYDLVKDRPHDDFFGLTPRQAYINHSEKYMKPIYGQDVFGKLAARQLSHLAKRRNGFALAVFSDCGFKAEVECVSKLFRSALVRLYRDGCDFTNDSRSYLEDVSVPNIWDISNNSTIPDLRHKASQVYQEIKKYF